MTRTVPAPLDEPVAPVRAHTIVLLGMASLGVWIAVLTPIQVLLPQQIAAIDPQGKAASLGWVTTCAAIGAMIACPVAGALSDRTTARAGRRHPWLAGGLVVFAAALVALSRQHTVLGVGVCWFVAQVSMNALYAALSSIVPDRVPRSQRALTSAVAGLSLPLGLVLGSLLVTVAVRGSASGYLLLACLLLVLGFPLVLCTSDVRLRPADRPAWSTRAFVAGFWISPRRHPDFAWAAGGRFAIQLCGSVGTLYLLYYLTDVVHLADPAGGVLVLIAIYTAGVLLTGVPSGWLSDIWQRRKVFVIASSVLMGAAMVILVFGDTFGAAVVAAGLLGLGYGVYLAVDTALITEVLPHARSRARDLGVINLANSAPQAFAPAIAGAIVAALHSYSVLYALAAALGIVGAAMVQPVRSVR